MAQRVLVVEDEKELAEILGEYLKVEGYEVLLAADGEIGLEYALHHNPNLILLDIMLPKVDGITICKRVRETSDIPIIMLSAKSGEMDKVVCLGIGADDYVTKPFSPLELIARVKANLRRTTKATPSVCRLKLNRQAYEAYIDGELLDLTTKEFILLDFLQSNENRVFSKEQIYDSVWNNPEYGDISSVAVYIKRIRQKLSAYGLDYIKTVWGAGYKYSATEQGDKVE